MFKENMLKKVTMFREFTVQASTHMSSTYLSPQHIMYLPQVQSLVPTVIKKDWDQSDNKSSDYIIIRQLNPLYCVMFVQLYH